MKMLFPSAGSDSPHFHMGHQLCFNFKSWCQKGAESGEIKTAFDFIYKIEAVMDVENKLVTTGWEGEG